MGINDKDYADALIYEKQKQAAAQQQQNRTYPQGALGQALTTSGTLSSAQTGIISSGLSNLTLTTANTGNATWNSNVNQPYGQFKALTEQDLKHDGMKAPLSALVDMWTVRWGGEWVSETEFQDDDFWRIALVRLTGANKLEKHNLANQYMSVYRIIE
jgi:hypothetical protein